MVSGREVLSRGDVMEGVRDASRRPGGGQLPGWHQAPHRPRSDSEDADFLRRHGVLPDQRIAAVQTGGCPHTAIRDDITANLGLVDVHIFVVDVAGGDKVPRKGGPGVTYSDLLVVNKTDLAPLVGADLEVMRRDAATVRADRPTVLISFSSRAATDSHASSAGGSCRGGAHRTGHRAPGVGSGHPARRRRDQHPCSGGAGRAVAGAHLGGDRDRAGIGDASVTLVLEARGGR